MKNKTKVARPDSPKGAVSIGRKELAELEQVAKEIMSGSDKGHSFKEVCDILKKAKA